MENTGNYYLINHLVLFTGLTDRTIRSYISSGILQGEKINGLWHFTLEQVEAFMRHPAVRPSILAKNNSLIYDYLLDTRKAKQEACIILDLPGADKQAVAEYFCCRISNGGYHDIRFSFDGVLDTARVILTGDTGEVLRLVDEFRQEQSRSGLF